MVARYLALLPWLVLGIALALGGCSSPDRLATDQLIDRLQSIDERNRKPAADELARKGPEIVPRLIEEMASDKTQVRFEVARVLGRLRDPRAVPVLIEALDDKSATVALTAAWSLGSIRSPQAVSAMLRYADDVSPGVRKQVAWALGVCAHADSLHPALADSARQAVIDALGDPKDEVREGAVLGVRELGLQGAVDHVIAMAADPSDEVRYLIVQLLDQLQAGAYRRTIGDLPGTTRGAIVDALISLLGDDQPVSIRTRAIRALGRSQDPRAQAPLERVRDDGREADRSEARQALRWLAAGLDVSRPSYVSIHAPARGATSYATTPSP